MLTAGSRFVKKAEAQVYHVSNLKMYLVVLPEFGGKGER
jgi:hypothetical protein